MRVTVKFFASYRELLGTEDLRLDLDNGSTVGQALDTIRARHPVLSGLAYSPLTACNLSQVGADHVLEDGDELAVFPPVSGG